MVEALGWTPQERLGRPTLELVHPDDRPQVERALREVLARPGHTIRHAARARHKDGGWRRYDVVARNLLQDPSVGGVVLNSRDVTEQHDLEERYRHAQKLEAVGRLAGGVAHDFNNLLTVILSSVEGCQRDLEAGRPVDPDDVTQIREAAERARDLTRQLLAFARKQVVAPVALDLNGVVQGSEKLLRRVVGEEIRLEVRTATDLWTVLCDPGQVEQVLVNLAVNARDAMPRGGTLTVETRNARVGPGAEQDSAERAGEWVQLVIRDTGAGMAPEVMAHLFEPFFTTKEPGRGTGLGLATVHGIVTQSGGHVHVRSEPGQGTEFTVCLPRSRARVAAAGMPAGAAAEAVEGSETVLLVEDDPQVRAVTARALERAGYRVLVATDGPAALALVAREGVRLDLVVTDVVMPGMTGPAVVEALRTRQPGLRALFVSGYTQDAVIQRGVLDTGFHFLAKPFTAAALRARVRAILDR
jgi:PAS domain S-box-containing protein